MQRPSWTVLLVGGAAAGVALAALVLVPWLVCDPGAFGSEARISCRLDRLRQAPDAVHYSAALESVRPLLDNGTPTRLLLKARDALHEGLVRGYNGPTKDLLAWIEQVFAERKARALQVRDELEPKILALRAPVDSRLPVERFPTRATIVLWEAGEYLARYAVDLQGGVATISRGDGGLPRVYSGPDEFRAIYQLAENGIGFDDWQGFLALSGKVVVER